MPKKRIQDLSAYKFSVVISGENKKAMDTITDNMSCKYGPFLNYLLENVCILPEDMQKDLTKLCTEKALSLYEQSIGAGDYEKSELTGKIQHYERLAKIFNLGIDVPIDFQNIYMKEITLKNGFVKVPKDWIFLNPEDAANCEYVGVVECRNSEKFEIPHFFFATTVKESVNYSDDLISKVNKLCCKKWPEFQTKVLDKQVDLIPDPEKHVGYLNTQEHLASPAIGYFSIAVSGETVNGDDKPPYGAVIVRENYGK